VWNFNLSIQRSARQAYYPIVDKLITCPGQVYFFNAEKKKKTAGVGSALFSDEINFNSYLKRLHTCLIKINLK
jgi:hypothetical protein